MDSNKGNEKMNDQIKLNGIIVKRIDSSGKSYEYTMTSYDITDVEFAHAKLTYKQKYELTRMALIDMLSWSTSGARYESSNPYMISAIKNNMKIIAAIDGIKDYLNVELNTAKYDNAYFKNK